METYGSVLTALGDRTRRAILGRLLDGPAPVARIAEGLPVSRPAVSQHLRVLRDAGLVSHEVVGTRHVYRVDPRGLAELRAFVEEFWERALAAYARRAEEGQT